MRIITIYHEFGDILLINVTYYYIILIAINTCIKKLTSNIYIYMIAVMVSILTIIIMIFFYRFYLTHKLI